MPRDPPDFSMDKSTVIREKLSVEGYEKINERRFFVNKVDWPFLLIKNERPDCQKEIVSPETF